MIRLFEFLSNAVLVVVCIYAILSLQGCGDESAQQVSAGTYRTSSYTEGELSPWHDICFEQGQIQIEQHYLDCTSVPFPNCDEEQELDERAIQLGWEHAVASSNALLEGCVGDGIWPTEFCYADYNSHLSFYVGLYCVL